jgi:hypothetical protein
LIGESFPKAYRAVPAAGITDFLADAFYKVIGGFMSIYFLIN